jgi:hypothetical protein
MADALRAKKDLSAASQSLEMGKSRPRATAGQEIGITDFAVGQSRMLYGLSMHSSAAARMYEQWHPLGVIGIISAFSSPVAVWSWNAFSPPSAATSRLETLAPHAAVRHRGAEDLQRSHRSGEAAAIFSSSSRPTTRSRAFVDDRRVVARELHGSTSVGRHVGERIASRLGRSHTSSSAAITRSLSTSSRTWTSSLPRRTLRLRSEGRPALHDDPTTPRSRVADRRGRAAAGRKLQAVRINPLDRRPDGSLVGASAVLFSALTVRSQGGEIRCGGNTLPGAGFR